MRYEIKHAIVRYAADTILEDVNFEIRDNEKVAIVGRNGCGKTTLLKLIAGDIEMANLDSDEECGIFMSGTQRIGYLRQIDFDDLDITAENEILKVFKPVFECEERLHVLADEMKNDTSPRLMNEYASLQAKMELLGGYTYRRDMETIFQRFGFTLEDLNKPMGTFSGGQQTKIAFVKLLLEKPDIMLLDEPTNHLDMPTIEWLEEYLKSYNHAVVIVSHDRMFLDRVIDVTYEIEYHRIRRYPGNYSAFMERKRLDAEKQEKDYEAQQKEIKRLTEWIEKWKNTPTKVASTHSKRMVIEHMVKIEKPRRFDTKTFKAQFEPRIQSHREVLTATGLEIGYDRVLSSVSFSLMRGERLAVIGENGKGKSTLLKTLIGQIPALGGRYTIGGEVQWIYFDQQAAVMESEDPKLTVLEDFWNEYPGLVETEVRQSLGSFLFTQEDVYKHLEQLSGGERVRLALCKLLKTKPNLLILDEPTNHMDIMGKEALESMLKNYSGTVLVVSHDRYFIKEIATEILDFGKDDVKQYPCGYEYYLEEKKKQEEQQSKGEVSTASAEKAQESEQRKPRYSPGKLEIKRKQQIERYERQIEESEERLQALRDQQQNPDIASDYEQLTELEQKISQEQEQQDNLFNLILELEEQEE
jgi:ATP-binding cassette subfamily F protein 3